MVKGGSVGLGIQSVLKDFEIEVKLTLKSDASAAIAIASRRGLGKVRHIEVHQLWIQDKVAKGEIQLVKCEGTKNLADSLTKYVTTENIQMHMNGTNQAWAQGRHEIMPEIS